MTAQKKNIPALRFPEFEGEWTQIKLGDKCNFQQGIQIDLEKQELFPKDGFIKFLRIENYTQNSTDFRYIPEEMAGTKRINSDEVAIVRYGASAGFVSRGYDGVLANNLFKIIPDKEIINSFLFIILSSYKSNSFFQSQMAGGAMPALSFGIVKNLELAYPIIPEQQKIADFLSAVDERIQQLTRKKELLEQYKKGVMQQLFSRIIRFKTDDGNDYPDWEEHRLGDKSFSFSGGTPTTTNRSYYSGSIPFIKSGEIKEEQTEQYISEAGLNSSSAKLVEAGDLLIALYGATSGEVAISKINGAINQAVLCIRSDYVNYYLYKYFEHKKESIISTYLQGGQGNLSATIIKSLLIPTPTIAEQQKIADFLRSIDDKIGAVQTEIEQTQLFKKGLLQQMFC